MRFRPLPGFTALFLPVFVLLVGLGAWQLERLQWKLALIAQIRHNMSAAPISLASARALHDRAEYRPVALTGRFDSAKETFVYATGPGGVPVYHLVTPLVLPDGTAMMIDRGYIPISPRNPASPLGSEPQGVVRVVGIWRKPDKPGPFTPAPDLKRRVWFARDIESIARQEHLKLAAPALLEEGALPNDRRWPRGGQTRVDIPNDHLQYALTWFLLASALLIVYFAYHRARGRLQFGSDVDATRA